jgi:formate-dependent nitrite reductase membrane component NrfD
VAEATFRSYYGQPIIKPPVWRASNVASYLFLGGVAGASSVVAAAAQLTGRPGLARASKVTSTAAAGLSGAVLVHDLGRPERFVNMLRVFKPTSPLSMGSWLLVAYSPMSAAASFAAVTGRLPWLGTAGTAGAAVLGPGVATYTAALISNTAVPAWHDGYREMPFLFAASAASAAAGIGMIAAPLDESGPVLRLGAGAGVMELGLMQLMTRHMGAAGEAYRESKRARRFERAATVLTGAAIVLGARCGRRSRAASALAGAGLVAGSVLTRLAIFAAGLASAEDPRYTVVPQRRRLGAGLAGSDEGEGAGGG